MRHKSRILSAIVFIEKAFLFLFAFAAVVVIMLSLSSWSGRFYKFFFLTDQWLLIVEIFLFVFILNYILRKLLIWTWRAETRR